MSVVEYRLLVLALAWTLASIPLALLAWQVWLRPRPLHHVIPHEDAAPAGSFLDVVLPAPPEVAESGIPVRQWKRVDGWVALAAVVVLSLLMGPLSTGPGMVEPIKPTPQFFLLNLVFQLGLGGLLLFYLSQGRALSLTKIFGLQRHRPWMVPVWALTWLVPGTMAMGLINGLTMPWLQEWLGKDAVSPQMIVQALRDPPDDLTKAVLAFSVGIGAPFMEETVFRGFLYGVGKRFTHWSYAAIGSSLFFAVVHANVMSFVPLMLLGLLFTAAYEHTKNLLVPMVMHGTFNLCQVAIMFYAPQLVQQLDPA